MKRSILILALLCALVACRGRQPMPVPMNEPNDMYKSCEALKAEMVMIEGRVSKLAGEDKSKDYSNAAWGITGVFLYVPLLMLDLSEAEKIEMQAYQDRYRTLAVIAINKGCGRPAQPAQPQQHQ